MIVSCRHDSVETDTDGMSAPENDCYEHAMHSVRRLLTRDMPCCCTRLAMRTLADARSLPITALSVVFACAGLSRVAAWWVAKKSSSLVIWSMSERPDLVPWTLYLSIRRVHN